MYPISTSIFATPSKRDFSHTNLLSSKLILKSANTPRVSAVGKNTNSTAAKAKPSSIETAIITPIPLPFSDVSISSSTITSADLPMILAPSTMDIIKFTMPRKNGTFLYQGFFAGKRVDSTRICPNSSLTPSMTACPPIFVFIFSFPLTQTEQRAPPALQLFKW